MKTFFCIIALNSVIGSIQGTPTIKAAENFDAKKDAEVLQKAFADSKNLDNKAIQDVLSKRTCAQRVDIESAYRESYHEELSERIDKISCRDYKLLLRSLFYCCSDLLAYHLNRVLEKNIDRNKNAIEIMVRQTQSPEIHKNLTAAYERMFKRPYVDDIKKHLDGDFENVLLEMAGKSKPKEDLNEEAAKITADWLNREAKSWYDSRQFLDKTLNETPFEQLNLIFHKFKEMSGKEIEDVVKDRFGGAKENANLDLSKYLQNLL